MTSLCRHIFTAGRHCTQPAVKTTLYCRHHQVIKRTLAKVQPQPDPYGIHTPLPFLFPDDRAALQLNFVMIAQALNDRRIDVQTANAFNRIFRSCQINLQQGPLHEPDRQKSEPGRRNRDEEWLIDDEDSTQEQDAMVQEVILMPEGDEIALPREVLEEGEAALLHAQDCPCAVCDREYRGAPREQHHVQCKCGMCEEEKVQQRSELSSRPERNRDPQHALFSRDGVGSEPEGTAVPQPSNQTIDHPSALSIRGDQDRITNYQNKAREIFSQLGYPFEAPGTSSFPEKDKLSESSSAC